MWALISVFSPLFSTLIVGLLGSFLGKSLSFFISCTLMGLSTLGSILIFYDVGILGNSFSEFFFPWMKVGDFSVSWGMDLNTLTSVMVLTINFISFLVHIYSVGYMSKDLNSSRFMAYLSLFTFMMLMLVTSPNMIQLFFGWEGVGLASYLLIGFWYDRPKARAAALKAFVVNRVGDLGLILGIASLWYICGSLDISIVNTMGDYLSNHTYHFGSFSLNGAEVTCLCLFIGAMGKSAQIGLHVWLPDAMEGPTPVSALIHAATMVTAGVFLVARLSPLFEVAPNVLAFITIVGGTTTLFAGTVGLAQTDIKRIIAYSTCSQLGYMFFALGVSAYGVAILHLVTHAFFKALLFLGAGSVIHGMSDEQDIEKMGGIWREMPMTYAVMWVGSLALSGIPFFSGYYSKDLILEHAWSAGTSYGFYAFYLGIFAVFLTALYSWRLLILTFMGKARANERVMAHVHEPGLSMMVPLFILSLGAILSGYFLKDIFLSSEFWRGSLVLYRTSIHPPQWVVNMPVILAMFGIIVAYVFFKFKPKWALFLENRFTYIHKFFKKMWFFDVVYDRIFVFPILFLGNFLWKKADIGTIDRIGPDGLASKLMGISRRFSRLHTGILFHYGLIFLITLMSLIFIWHTGPLLIKTFF